MPLNLGAVHSKNIVLKPSTVPVRVIYWSILDVIGTIERVNCYIDVRAGDAISINTTEEFDS